MSHGLDDTHDPHLRSWVESANDPASDFPIQNLPFGRFRVDGRANRRIGVAIGDQIVDLATRGPRARRGHERTDGIRTRGAAALRQALSQGLRAGSAQRATFERMPRSARPTCEMELPCHIGDYTDFYASIHHATTVGKQFRPDNPLLPNYKWVPIGYHGRASSIRVSGQAFRRPNGQRKPPDAPVPIVGPSRAARLRARARRVHRGRATRSASRCAIGEAEEHVFGLVLLNDWSARDIQGWEYQPLGPFLAKNFATTISPWIVTLDALAPFRSPFRHPDDDPAPLPYLDSARNRDAGAIDITLEAWLQTEAHAQARPCRRSPVDVEFPRCVLDDRAARRASHGERLQPAGRRPARLGHDVRSRARARQARCWSSPRPASNRSRLSNGETRTFLEDGDTVILRAFCERPGFRRIGFGECRGSVLAAADLAGAMTA